MDILPDEVLYLILANLDTNTRYRVCKKWIQIINPISLTLNQLDDIKLLVVCPNISAIIIPALSNELVNYCKDLNMSNIRHLYVSIVNEVAKDVLYLFNNISHLVLHYTNTCHKSDPLLLDMPSLETLYTNYFCDSMMPKHVLKYIRLYNCVIYGTLDRYYANIIEVNNTNSKLAKDGVYSGISNCSELIICHNYSSIVSLQGIKCTYYNGEVITIYDDDLFVCGPVCR